MKLAAKRFVRGFYSAPGISFIPWLFMLPFSITGTGVFVPEGGPGGEPAWFAVGLLAHLVLLPLILILNLLARMTNFRFGSILIVGLFLAGALRGLTVSVLAEYFSLVDEANFAWRIGAAMILTASWLAVGNAAVFEIRQYSSSFGKLKGELLKQSEYLNQSELHLGESRNEVLQETMKLVDLGLIQVETKDKDFSTLQRISNELHRLVDEGLTPLIRKLQSQATSPEYIITPYQKVSGLEIARIAFIQSPFYFGSAFAIQTLSTITSKIWGFGFWGAMLDLLLVGLAMLASYKLGAFVLGKLQSEWQKLLSNLLFLMLPAVISGLLPLVVVPGSEFSLVIYMSLFNNVFAAGFLTAIGYAARFEAERALSDLELAIEQTALARSRAEQLRLVEKKRLERILHGSVQSKIRSLALQIERTGIAPDREQLEEFRNSIYREISSPSNSNLIDFLYDLQELWGASAEIQYELEDEIPDILLNDNNAHVAVIEIIREVVSNAMKHSRSTKLQFKIGRYQGISDTLGVITITANFDGTPIKVIFPGDGVKTIGELSSHFDYHSDSKSNYFNAEVPVSAQASVATTGT